MQYEGSSDPKYAHGARGRPRIFNLGGTDNDQFKKPIILLLDLFHINNRKRKKYCI